MKDDIDEIIGAGGGGKKGGGGSDAANTLRSNATARIIELISEGPIVGLVDGARSIYFDETPLVSEDGSENFDNVIWQQRLGNPDDEHLNGHSAAETTNPVNVEVKQATGPVVRTITDQNADAVRVMIRIDSLFRLDDQGKAQTNSLHYKIEICPYGGEYQLAVLQELDNEKCTSPTQMAHRIELPVNGYPWDIRVTRITADTNDDKDQRNMSFENFTTLVEGRFTYPHSALVALEVEAESMGESVPDRAYRVMGRIISVPSNYDPVARSYTGIWDGTFKQEWTNNPAWIFHDLLINDRYGMGEFIGDAEVAGLKWQLYTIGQYCDEFVPSGFKDGTGDPVLEPRFTFNGVIQTRKEAYHVLQQITTAFRGMGYWALGQVFASADMPADPVKLVTPANVIDGRFEYSSTATKARNSVAVVQWNDPNDFYRSAAELVINNAALAKNGWREKRVELLGCTSRGLAHRYGKWALDVENNETETVQYQAGLDHLDILPGDIVSIADPTRATVRMGGRIASHANISAARDRVTFDAPIEFQTGESYTLWLTQTDGELVELSVLSWAEDGLSVEVTNEEISVEQNAVFIVAGTDVEPRQYRVLTIKESEENIFQITALFHDPNKYARVEENVTLEPISYTREKNVQPVVGLAADELAYIDGDGAVRSKMRLTWQAPSGVVVREYVIQMDTPTEVRKFVTSTKNTDFEIEGLERGDHTFYVTTVDRTGKPSAAAMISATVVGSDIIAQGSVGSLGLVDAAGTTEFFGRDVRIEWKNLFPDSPGATGSESATALYDYNTVRVYHSVTNTLLRETVVRGSTYTYSFEQNTRDCTAAALSVSAARGLRFEVSVTSKRNLTSAAATLTVNNPVPTATLPTVTQNRDTITVSLPENAPSDVRGMKVWIESNNSYDPALTTPKFNGASGYMSWQGEFDTTYYVRAAYYDQFDDTYNVTNIVEVTTDPLVAVSAPGAPTGLALSTALRSDGKARVTATWTANTESDLYGYELLVAENSGNEVGFATSTEELFWDVEPGTVLSVRVSAINTSGMKSGYTTVKTITAASDSAAPAVPSGVAAQGAFEGIWLEWNENGESDFSHYEIRRSSSSAVPSAGDAATYSTKSGSFYNGSLDAGETWYYWVRAVDVSGNKSAWSATVSATTVSVPGSISDYVNSREENLVTNGTGLLGDNTNFSSTVFDGSDTFSGQGMFTRESINSTNFSDDYLPVTTEYTYRLSTYAKKLDAGASRFYAGVACFDTDKLTISPLHTMRLAGTDTTLAQPLKPGDTEIHLTDASNWNNGGQTYQRSPIVWGYKNSRGYQYPDYTYSRYVMLNGWDVGGVNHATNTVTLNAPWPHANPDAGDGAWPAGTAISNGASGGSYKYIGGTEMLTDDWMKFEGTISGVDLDGVNATNKFSPGTAYVRLVMLMNYPGDAGTHKQAFSNVWFGRDLSNLENWAHAGDPSQLDGGKIYASTIGADQIGSNQIITQLANIKDALITNAKIANATIEGAKIKDATIGSAKIDKVDAGKITVSGSTTLADWRKGGDLTKIDGGQLSANTVEANKLTIGQRGVSFEGMTFWTSGDTLNWEAGTIRYIGDNGAYTSRSITAGSVGYTGTRLHLYWTKDATSLSASTNMALAFAATAVPIGVYNGGTDWTNNLGRTIIEGSMIQTGAIFAEHVQTSTLTADKMAADVFSANNIQAGKMSVARLTVDELMLINNQNGALAAGKVSAYDTADGIFFGRTLENNGSVGFGLSASKVGTGNLKQSFEVTEENGLRVENAQFFRRLVQPGTATTYTTTQTITPAPTSKFFSMQMIGGGGGGGGGHSSSAYPGQDGGTTAVTLKDGSTVIETWTALGGNGGPGPAANRGWGQGGEAGENSNWGTGGSGGAVGGRTGGSTGGEGDGGGGTTYPGTAGSDATGYGAGGGGGGPGTLGNSPYGGHGGDAGEFKSISAIYIGDLASPSIEISIGTGGAGASPGYQDGGDGAPGRVDITEDEGNPVRADVLPLTPTYVGTMSNNGPFPNYGSGFWEICRATYSGTTSLQIGRIEVDDLGNDIWAVNSDMISFVSNKTPVITTDYAGTTQTLNYRFYKMGD